ncbi:claudin domain-containing protein 1b isoform X1 [Lates japonicus]|uniref:Claudin domain-containing protein 1b isoform X1 n=1 Tax=Lates japonicus TaxID=270547 RepID=A0AAD3RN74_LATJO|nr:claudin domain-containing protein 1b isoform X1 [Lates japonicus]
MNPSQVLRLPVRSFTHMVGVLHLSCRHRLLFLGGRGCSIVLRTTRRGGGLAGLVLYYFPHLLSLYQMMARFVPVGGQESHKELHRMTHVQGCVRDRLLSAIPSSPYGRELWGLGVPQAAKWCQSSQKRKYIRWDKERVEFFSLRLHRSRK